MKELKELLGDFENSEKILEFVANLKTDLEGKIQAEKEIGIHKNRERNQEIIGLKEKLKAFQDGDNKGKPEFEVKLKELTEKFEESQKLLSEERSKANKNKIRSELTSALKGKIYAEEAHISNLINENRVFVDGDNLYFKRGDETLSFDKGLEDFLNSPNVEKRMSQKPGSGGGGERGTGDQDKKMGFLDALSEIK